MQFTGQGKWEKKVRKDTLNDITFSEDHIRMMTNGIVKEALDANDGGATLVELIAGARTQRIHQMRVHVCEKAGNTIETEDPSEARTFADKGWSVRVEVRTF